MSPATILEGFPADVSNAVAKSQPVEKVEEVEKEVTPLEAISHGDILPGKPREDHGMTGKRWIMSNSQQIFPLS